LILAGPRPQTSLGELISLSQSLGVFKGLTSKGRERRGSEDGGEGKGRGNGKDGNKRKGKEGKRGEGGEDPIFLPKLTPFLFLYFANAHQHDGKRDRSPTSK